MILDVARLLAVLLSILSLYRVFHAAFLTPVNIPAERGQAALLRLVLAGVVALIGGLLFREPSSRTSLVRTLPIQLFCWAATGMTVLFAASWYIETFCILYGDVRY